MNLNEQEFDIPLADGADDPIGYFRRAAAKHLADGESPVRFAVTSSGPKGHHCELAVLTGLPDRPRRRPGSIFDFLPRGVEDQTSFNAVLLVPTGIGAVIGGHAGDAGPVARLLAKVCDTLITHPNVVNASDINELPENGLYVEGSVICRMLMGTAALQRVRSNRVLLVIDEHPEGAITDLMVNSASAARATLGQASAGVVRLDPPIKLSAELSSSGRAAGRVEELERLCDALESRRGAYDAVALGTAISVPPETTRGYFTSKGNPVNPWGGVEAMLTHAVSTLYDMPSAHAPMMDSMKMMGRTFGVVDPRMAAEDVSRCFIHCVLKGLQNSPRIVTDRTAFRHPGVLSAADVSALVIPDGCVGLPTLAAVKQGIPVIAVRENRNRMRNDLTALPFAPGQLRVAENYLEAAGLLAAMKAGVSPETVRRPLSQTEVFQMKAVHSER
ncbi:MAG: DUF3326 domain-containing protein [Elusimicrobia bacterium]|nr:DUF3326 domain-containing protein [Elusimicrobiota bacterium]